MSGSDAPGEEVTLGFAGDVHFMGRTQVLLEDPATAFGPLTGLLSAPDLTLLNLETAVTERGVPEAKRYLFRTDARAVTALHAGGVDAVSLANNHSMDYGRDGLADTVDALRVGGVSAFGAGRDADEAFSPWRTTVRATRVAVFGFSQVDDLAESWAATDDRSGIAMAFDVDRAVAAVAEARADSDVVIVMPHWGTERSNCADANQRRFARRLADAGADVIVGAHAHVLQATGWLGRTYVAYGMGNFLWYSSGLSPLSAYTGLLTLTLRGRVVVRSEFTPAVVSATGQPIRLTGVPADVERGRMDMLRACSGLTADPA